MIEPVPSRRHEPDAEGFVDWTFDPPRFSSGFGPLRTRAEPDGRARIRIETGPRAANVHDRLHGGFALACIDQALSLAITTLRDEAFGGVVTLSLATSFIGAGTVDEPIDVVVAIVRETGRLFFLSGEVVQGEETLLGWQATMRKVRR